MEGGESGGGLMEGRECRGWGMLPCVRGEAGTSSVVVPRWRPVVVACRLLVACRLPIACHLTFRLSSCVACLRVSLSSGVVNGWCWVFGASRGAGLPWPFVAGGVVTSLCRGRVVRRRRRRPWGGRSPFASAHASSGLVCYTTVVLGLQTRSVRWGAMTTGWPLTFPSAHVTYVAWVLRSFAIMLALLSWGSKRG